MIAAPLFRTAGLATVDLKLTLNIPSVFFFFKKLPAPTVLK